MIEQIRLLHSRGYKIKKIAAALRVSKNTVRRYIRTKEPPPEDPPRESKPIEKAEIDWVYAVEQSALGRPLKRIYEELRPVISYSHFTKGVHARTQKSPEIAIRQQHEPGEKTQVDYCEGVPIYDAKTGAATKTQFFCGVLPASSYIFGEFTLSQKSVDFIRSHERMWSYFGGVSKYVVIDNLKSGVSKPHRYDPDINPQYCDFANHCGFAVLPARVRTPRDKACVEASIGVIQRDFFDRCRMKKFYSLAALNQEFRLYLDELNSRPMADYGVSRLERFALEAPLLKALPSESYEVFEWKEAKVHPDCCIELFCSVYSVPYIHVGKKVRVKFNDKLVIILDLSGLEVLAIHARKPKYKPSVLDEHLPPYKVQRTSFDIVKAERLAQSIGPQTGCYVAWQFDGDPYPLRVLRRIQGLVRFFESYPLPKETLEFAAMRAMDFQRKDLRYFMDCAKAYTPGGKNLRLAEPPKRDISSIHLQTRNP